MKRRVLVFLWAALAGSISYAQSDSTTPVYSDGFRRQYDFFAADAISQPFIQTRSYGLIEGGYKKTGGEYRLGQDATSQQDIFFNTQGARQVKKFLVSGRFAYERSIQDSTGYTLRYDLHGASPYYFYTVKKGHWEMGRYQLQGTISRQYANDRLTIALGGAYNALNAWRSNDPRPEYFDQSMQAGPALQYALSPSHSIGIAGNYYKRNAETTIEYRNDNYSQGPGDYPEYITYIQFGYGKQKNQSTRRGLRSDMNGWGWQGIYRGNYSFGEVTLKGGYRLLDSRYYLPGTGQGEVPTTYGYFYEDIANVDIYWLYHQGKNTWSLSGSYTNHYGEDFNTELNANNYLYTLEELVIRPLFSHYAKNGLQYEAGLDASLSDLFRADGSSSVYTDYQYARLAARAAYYWKFTSSSHILKTGLSAGAQLPVSSEVNNPAQSSDFINGVVFHDAYYYRAASFTGQLELLYSFAIKKINSFIRLQTDYRQASIKEATTPSFSLPGTQRWYWQASIGVTL